MKNLLLKSAVSAILVANAALADDAVGQLYSQQGPGSQSVNLPVASDVGPNGSASLSVGVNSNGVSGFGVSGSSGSASAGVNLGVGGNVSVTGGYDGASVGISASPGGSVTLNGGYGGVSGSVTNTPMGPAVNIGINGSF